LVVRFTIKEANKSLEKLLKCSRLSEQSHYSSEDEMEASTSFRNLVIELLF